MSALEVKPGKYRTRNGIDVDVVSNDGGSPELPFCGLVGSFAVCWRSDGTSTRGYGTFDLIERIEDEPKAEEQNRIVGAVECSVETGKPVRGFVTKAAYDALWNVIGCERDSYIRELTTARCMVLTADEYDALVQAARVVEDCKFYVKTVEGFAQHAQAVTDEQRKQITRLEAENESLSRQLRSRERNKEPASARKVLRWSPMV